MQALQKFLEDVDLYISQHSIYISKLERAMRDGKPFEHRDCHSCNFGKDWDSQVKPLETQMPPEVSALAQEIEANHARFHEVAQRIDPVHSKPQDEENLKQVEEISTHLFQLLLKLKRAVS